MSTSFGWEGNWQRQVWFIPLTDVRGVCTVRSLENACLTWAP